MKANPNEGNGGRTGGNGGGGDAPNTVAEFAARNRKKILVGLGVVALVVIFLFA